MNLQNSSILYAGPDGYGIYRSTNGGNSWTVAGGGRDVRSFALDPTTASIAYASTVQYILKTSDHGGNWYSSNSGLPNPYINGLAVDSNNSSTVYAGPDRQGIWKTTNAGASWFVSNGGLPATSIIAAAVNPMDSRIIYAGSDSLGMFRSVDGGENWSTLNDGLTNLNVGRYALAMDN